VTKGIRKRILTEKQWSSSLTSETSDWTGLEGSTETFSRWSEKSSRSSVARRQTLPRKGGDWGLLGSARALEVAALLRTGREFAAAAHLCDWHHVQTGRAVSPLDDEEGLTFRCAGIGKNTTSRKAILAPKRSQLLALLSDRLSSDLLAFGRGRNFVCDTAL
jgi:hypothetical protein